MRISDAHAEQFQKLVKDKCGTEITLDEAVEKGTRLLRLIEIIYRPMTQDEYRQVQANLALLGIPA